jgi:hypothetical protein
VTQLKVHDGDYNDDDKDTCCRCRRVLTFLVFIN